ncbi:MAG: adenylate/guanylate cyclase domain-containing protein, partial [Planctomycetota bacterium]|nr:adenylate/guanylate cyclase domain-containing protein [Planctomycetota bacterium]
IEGKTQYPLSHNDTFRIGSTTFTFISEEEAKPKKRKEESAMTESKIIASLYGGSDISKSIEDIPEHLRIGLRQSLAMGIPLKELSQKVPTAQPAQQVDKFYILYQLGREVARAPSLDAVLEVAMMLIFEIINAERGAIQLFDPQTGELATRITRFRSPEKASTQNFAISKTIADHVVRNKAFLITSDTRDDPRLQNALSIVQQNVRSVITVPLSDWEKDDVLGVIYLDNMMNTYAFKEEDLELLSAIANLVAIRLKQDRLYEQLAHEAVRRSNLAQFLSPDHVEVIMQQSAGGKAVCLEVTGTEVTALFVDIVGFTKIAEEMDPALLANLLNEFFDSMCKVVFTHKGHVNKFVGDSIFAVFGAPVANEDHAVLGVQAALDMQKEMDRLRETTGAKFKLRVGVNSGAVVAGNIGSSQRKEYTILGDTVNIAKRLEEVATPGKVCVGERTFELLHGKFKARQLSSEKLKGKEKTIKMYEIIG